MQIWLVIKYWAHEGQEIVACLPSEEQAQEFAKLAEIGTTAEIFVEEYSLGWRNENIPYPG